MQTQKSTNKIQNKIDANKIASHQKTINRFVNTEGMDAASEAFNQVEIAKESRNRMPSIKGERIRPPFTLRKIPHEEKVAQRITVV